MVIDINTGQAVIGGLLLLIGSAIGFNLRTLLRMDKHLTEINGSVKGTKEAAIAHETLDNTRFEDQKESLIRIEAEQVRIRNGV